MRSDTAHQHVVPVEHQVLHRDGRAHQPLWCAGDVVGAIAGGDVLHDHAQSGKALAQRVEHVVDKPRFTVKECNQLEVNKF